MKELWVPSLPFAHILLRAAVVYVFVLLILRVSGKRQIGQMGAAEFVALLLVSNAVQNSMNGGDNSITGGLVLAAVIMALSGLLGWLSYRSKRISDLIQGRPVMLIYKGEVVAHNLVKSGLAQRELHVMLRHQGFEDLRGIHEAVLEANGTLSVIKTEDLKPRSA
ncbi:MAG TPA: YetF domain-containing protein [Elusimicrobiota bacterium]|nr:YetF domain-containing protein [Elusimicrobiota bacterium]